jgi:hypothetical protein
VRAALKAKQIANLGVLEGEFGCFERIFGRFGGVLGYFGGVLGDKCWQFGYFFSSDFCICCNLTLPGVATAILATATLATAKHCH